MLRPWVQWLVDHNMKFVMYFIWLISLPLFWFNYLTEAMDDAEYVFDEIKSARKGS